MIIGYALLILCKNFLLDIRILGLKKKYKIICSIFNNYFRKFPKKCLIVCYSNNLRYQKISLNMVIIFIFSILTVYKIKNLKVKIKLLTLFFQKNKEIILMKKFYL